jgi:hypothetical protein
MHMAVAIKAPGLVWALSATLTLPDPTVVFQEFDIYCCAVQSVDKQKSLK